MVGLDLIGQAVENEHVSPELQRSAMGPGEQDARDSTPARIRCHGQHRELDLPSPGNRRQLGPGPEHGDRPEECPRALGNSQLGAGENLEVVVHPEDPLPSAGTREDEGVVPDGNGLPSVVNRGGANGQAGSALSGGC
jgi:hypothetical protein